MERFLIKDFAIGQRVSVSDGTEPPPARFNKKMEAWKDRNYTGTITTIEEPSEYEPLGSIETTRDDFPDKPWIQFRFWKRLDRAIVEPLEGVAT